MKQHDYAFTTLTGAADVARALNRGCDCRSLDPARLRQQLEAEPALLGLAADIALYWADGQRTLGEILDLTELECDVRDPEGLLVHFRLLEKLAALRFK